MNTDEQENELPIDYVAEQIVLREEAENAGLYDDLLSEADEYDLWKAVSTLSDLMKQTNSSLSTLLKNNGYDTSILK